LLNYFIRHLQKPLCQLTYGQLQRVFMFREDNVMQIKKKCWFRGLQTTARGPNPTREVISPAPRSYIIQPQRHFVNNKKIIYLRKLC